MTRVHEPVTAFTDYGLAVVAALLAARLMVLPGAPAQAWAASFAAAGVAAALGGTSHGFGPQMRGRTAVALWRATLLAVITAGTLVVAGSATACLRPALQLAVIALAVGKSAAAVVWTWREPQFRRAVASYGLDLVLVAVLHAYRWDLRGSGWILAAVAMSVAAGVVQGSHVRPHRLINHNDLYHLVQAAALYLLYRGAVMLVV